MVDPKPIICTLLDKLHKDLIGFIDINISQGVDTEEQWFKGFQFEWYITRNWTSNEVVWRRFYFDLGDKEYTFESFLNFFQSLEDSKLSEGMYESLTNQVQEHVAERLRYWRDQQITDGQAALHYEHEAVGEEAA